MSASFEVILLSRSFTFIVGADEVPIAVHEATFADQSPGLKALMRTEMSEGLAREAGWEDVDKEIFIRFAQFTYIGDYSIPKMIVKPSALPADEEPLPSSTRDDFQLSDEWSFRASVKKAGKKHFTPPIPVFKNLNYARPIPQFNFADTYDPTVGDGPSENLGEIVQIHASLYVLADKWRIDRLKRLTLFKIHKTLSLFSLDTPKLKYIINFMRYIYSDKRTLDLKKSIDNLKKKIVY
ncbi:uncharacterized protein PAC_11591 [Phialocephala subalpina]|uniref:BTB domain-containing protein n=1 Tax=Phialocephala subalpina TaxID=576137 RepID=A0A1L7X9J5_9HELO|nr:uncharacterized protein PAC_11591 [Phialocephala subalpina]